MSGVDLGRVPDLQALVDLIAAHGTPMSVPQICGQLAPRTFQVETIRGRLKSLVRLGRLQRSGHYPVLFSVAEPGSSPDEASAVERVAVRDTSRPDWLTDQVIADEVEAEKVWTLAGVLRAANTAWGIDMGIDADVREARALMAEARRQVRDNAPLGQHHREQELPFSSAPVTGPLGAEQREAAR